MDSPPRWHPPQRGGGRPRPSRRRQAWLRSCEERARHVSTLLHQERWTTTPRDHLMLHTLDPPCPAFPRKVNCEPLAHLLAERPKGARLRELGAPISKLERRLLTARPNPKLERALLSPNPKSGLRPLERDPNTLTAAYIGAALVVCRRRKACDIFVLTWRVLSAMSSSGSPTARGE